MTKTPSAGRLLLLDGHSLAYRAFYALPVENFSTTTGSPTNAVYGFTSMLINTLRDEAPTHLAVAFDVSRATFRSEAFPEYKANRTSTPDEFRPQVSLIREVLDALRIQVVAVEGYEADDAIATIAVQAEKEGFDVLILTGDRDAFQLVSDQVTVLYPKRGVSDLARITPAEVQERYGLSPVQYPDYAALRGDPSDNLPSIPGVGEKTAAKWVREFGSLEALCNRVDEVKGKAGDALRAHLSVGAAQPSAHGVAPGRAGRRHAGGPRGAELGSRRGARRLRHVAVPRPAGAAVGDAGDRRAGGRSGLRDRWRGAGPG